MDEDFHYLVHSLHWGHPTIQQQGSEQRWDSSCLDHIPQYKRVPITTITYPSWDSLSGSVSFQKMNPDSLTDLLITIWGRVGDTRNRHDTLRPLLLFGQHGLDTLKDLDLAKVEGFQATPFFAMVLRFGTDLIEPEVRDLSGRTSHLIAPIAYNIDRRDSIKHPGNGVMDNPIQVRVYPNPTGTAAQIESESTPAGEYSVEVVGVNGQVYRRQEVSVSATSGLFRVLDLHDIPSGYYLVRLHSASKLIGSYPIIITR
ncbi:MAG: T9SS type A sorting domain-containing protein [Bacteroidota bacterium]